MMNYGHSMSRGPQFSKRIIQRAAIFELALFLVSLFVGISAADDETLKVASPWEPKSLDPIVYQLSVDVSEPLLSVDSEGKLSPMLAQSWDVSEDGRTWTFHLREGVSFHDGTPFNAEAAKLSLERTFRRSAEYSSIKAFPVESVTAPDEYTLVITTSRPFAPLAGYLTKDATEILAASSFDSNDEVVEPIGTGPFKFDSWVPKESMTGVRFEDYWGSKAKVEKVVFSNVPEEKTRESMLRAGEVDIIGTISPALAKKLAEDSSFKVYEQEEMGRVRHLLLNVANPPLDDVLVRQAISMAIDRDLICDSLLEGMDQTASAPFSSNLYWSNDNLETPSYDPEEAIALLEEAGWSDSDNDGIMDKDGEDLKLSLFTYPSRPELPSIAEALKDQLGQVGIDIEITILDDSAVREQAKGGKVDIYLVSVNTLLNRDPDTWASYFTTESYYYDCMNYSPDDVADLIEKGRETMDQEARKEIYDQLQERILKDVPVVYLTYYTGISASSSDIQDYELSLIGRHHLENAYKA
jgi:peptide/nickel transport system substrate-binding protein